MTSKRKMKEVLDKMPVGEPVLFKDLGELTGRKDDRYLREILDDLLELGLVEKVEVPSVRFRVAWRRKII